jgi:predicted small secreted protein
MITSTKRIAVLLLLSIVLSIVGVGCHTAHGFGQDVERTGEKIQGGTE